MKARYNSSMHQILEKAILEKAILEKAIPFSLRIEIESVR